MSNPLPPASLINAFVLPDEPDSGNPAAVVLLEQPDWPEPDTMQALATHYNLSETAFILPTSEPDRFGLRWFTPAAEVELCGHATLASAHHLFQSRGQAGPATLTFDTRFRGPLICTRTDDHAIAMEFPIEPVTPVPLTDLPPDLVAALRCADPVGLARTPYDFILELPSATNIRAATPDWQKLAAIDLPRGVCITATADDGVHDITSRFFAPRLRINEDPVTGSLHCALAPFWSPRLNKPTLRCHQASPRGGSLEAAIQENKTQLIGHACTVKAYDHKCS